MEDLQQVMSFAIELARESGALIVRERRNAALTMELKRDIELVTSADHMADELICQGIRQRFPGHAILAEESATEIEATLATDGPLWIIDPIDGTVNFAHGHFQVAVSIAFIEKGRVRAGVVYNPFLDELFQASEGGGAFLNNEPIRVGTQTTLRRALIATGFPYDKTEIDILVRRLSHILAHCADVRRLGSAALDICWVAAGRLDGYYESLSIWDFAAAQLIAREAGARYGHFRPVPAGRNPQFHDRDILVANPALYTQLEALLQEAGSGAQST